MSTLLELYQYLVSQLIFKLDFIKSLVKLLFICIVSSGSHVVNVNTWGAINQSINQ